LQQDAFDSHLRNEILHSFFKKPKTKQRRRGKPADTNKSIRTENKPQKKTNKVKVKRKKRKNNIEFPSNQLQPKLKGFKSKGNPTEMLSLLIFLDVFKGL